MARVFDEALAEVSPAARRTDTARYGRSGGVYSYRTADGVRWRFVYRRSDGTQTTKRGFASERAARDARRRLTEQVERGEVRHTKETFGGYWERWLARRKPYPEAGTWTGYEIAGRKRLVPAFGARPLGELSVDDIREFVAELADEVEAGELAAKTVNNALGTLVVCLNSAVDDGLLRVNPALRVQRLPPAHLEREYLRLDEIPRYLDACSNAYRPLAELLIGSGLRISEALALRVSDLELEETGGAVVVYRSRKSGAVGSAKSDRFRSVEIGPGLCVVLRDQVARRAELAAGDRAAAVLFVMPVRTAKRSKGRWESAGVGRSLDRNTVSRDWHKQALEDAAPPRYAASRAAAYGRCGVACCRECADVRAAPARSRGHQHDRALLRTSRATRPRRRRGGDRRGDRASLEGSRLEQCLLIHELRLGAPADDATRFRDAARVDLCPPAGPGRRAITPHAPSPTIARCPRERTAAGRPHHRSSPPGGSVDRRLVPGDEGRPRLALRLGDRRSDHVRAVPRQRAMGARPPSVRVRRSR
jgi:integrase